MSKINYLTANFQKLPSAGGSSPPSAL